LEGKYFEAVGCQFSPEALALMSVSSSLVVHVVAALEFETPPAAAVVEMEDEGRWVTSFGMLIMGNGG
jgi:hypothetical protein